MNPRTNGVTYPKITSITKPSGSEHMFAFPARDNKPEPTRFKWRSAFASIKLDKRKIHIQWSVSISIKFKQINLIRQPCEITDVSFVRSLCSLAPLPPCPLLLIPPAWNEAFGKRAWGMSHFGWYFSLSVLPSSPRPQYTHSYAC